MPPLVIGRDSITIGGKILETSKSIGLTPKVEAIPALMTIERMYPPLRNVSSNNHTISGQSYGNGLYVINESSTYGLYDPFNCFNTTDSIGGAWANGNRYIQPNGTFSNSLTDNIVAGYTGDWLKIKFPVAINLTKYSFRQRTGSAGLLSRAPQNFKIYGSNDEINWVELTQGTNISYVSELYETTISTTGTYNSFGLVVNKLLGNNSDATLLNFDEWFIHGMEKLDPNNYSIVPFHEPINDDYKYIPFVNTGANQTPYNIHFSENTECDILIVGGGGGGGGRHGGGGGAGGLIYQTGLTLTGIYNINVGKGGNGGGVDYSIVDGINGNNSSLGTHVAIGGGFGNGPDSGNGGDGGSGGGSTYANPGLGTPGQGNNGGDGATNASPYNHGGGGGAGAVGVNGTSNSNGNGGIGREIGITGVNIFYAGGGGGGGHGPNAPNIGLGGNGGGGNGGGPNLPDRGDDGVNGLGGGGGGSSVSSSQGGGGGNGGSGIVIIRYKIIKIPFDAQWTYNPSNLNVYHLGNVGISNINPTSALDVLGSVVVNGGISTNSYIASTKTFKIEHPLNINKWLYHGCIEAPRFDNIYRGKKMVINGTCEVDIDSECNTTGGMTTGTFMTLNNNFSLHLQNKSSFDGVKGEIIDGKIIISCENIEEEIEVEWLVIGERRDEGIVRNNLTNNEGMLICEHELTF